MKIQLVSDLHLEFFNTEQIVKLVDKLSLKSNADVLILAGDICSLNPKSRGNFSTFINLIEDRYPGIIYILGNHEYYGTSRQEIYELRHRISKYHNNLHLLENKSLVIGDSNSNDSSSITFYGTTLWFEETVEANLKKYSLNDYHQIKDFTPDIWCRKAISYIKQIPNDSSKKVLITHHVPHSRFISPKYIGNELNCFYLNEIGKYLDKFDLVVFGHSHESVNCQFSERTLAISNPRGYVNFPSTEGENNNFNYQLIIDI